MALTAHLTRAVYPPGLYSPPEQPHHVHLANGCVDHTACPPDHWIGGPPQRDHPHHVEWDGETGQWGYTRLTTEEVADLKLLWEYEAELAEAQAQAAEEAMAKRVAIIRGRAAEDPAFKALAEHLGIALKE